MDVKVTALRLQSFGLPDKKDGQEDEPDEISGQAIGRLQILKFFFNSKECEKKESYEDGPQEGAPSFHLGPSKREMLHWSNINVGELDTEKDEALGPVAEIPVKNLVVRVLVAVKDLLVLLVFGICGA
jgi:hypothetical protein